MVQPDPAQVELVVLQEIVDLHPDHLSPVELVLKLSGERDEAEEIEEAISELKASGLCRYIGEVVAPTHAALRAHALLAAD
jgi:hypothetical protein